MMYPGLPMLMMYPGLLLLPRTTTFEAIDMHTLLYTNLYVQYLSHCKGSSY